MRHFYILVEMTLISDKFLDVTIKCLAKKCSLHNLNRFLFNLIRKLNITKSSFEQLKTVFSWRFFMTLLVDIFPTLLELLFSLLLSAFIEYIHAILADVLLSLILALSLCKKNVLSLPGKPQPFKLLDNLFRLLAESKTLLLLGPIDIQKSKRS